mmetsp:Transcript_28475/g.93033  ORF Transcript_28475/g.93033 Transcript_28475/m.93033 type:complete len:265 (+) Transcript_28475:279-1073(+)
MTSQRATSSTSLLRSSRRLWTAGVCQSWLERTDCISDGWYAASRGRLARTPSSPRRPGRGSRRLRTTLSPTQPAFLATKRRRPRCAGPERRRRSRAPVTPTPLRRSSRTITTASSERWRLSSRRGGPALSSPSMGMTVSSSRPRSLRRTTFVASFSRPRGSRYTGESIFGAREWWRKGYCRRASSSWTRTSPTKPRRRGRSGTVRGWIFFVSVGNGEGRVRWRTFASFLTSFSRRAATTRGGSSRGFGAPTPPSINGSTLHAWV